MLGKGMSG